jgi:hypothetical protein
MLKLWIAAGDTGGGLWGTDRNPYCSSIYVTGTSAVFDSSRNLGGT